MRILMAAPLLPHPAATAGGALVVYGELDALARRHEVALVSFAGASPADRQGLETLRRLGVNVAPVWRVPEHGSMALRRRSSLAARWLATLDPLRTLKFHDVRVQAAIDDVARDRQLDLIHVEDNAMAQYRYPARVPSVLTEQDVRAAEGGSGLEGGRWRHYQREVWGRFDRIQVYTQRDAAAIRRVAPHLGDRVRVNPFGVAPGPAPDPELEREDRIAFLGGFSHPPNVKAAVWLAREILPLVRAHRAKAHLLLVGADPPRRVRALASDAVTVTGFVPDVEPFLASAAVVVAPLRSGSGMRVKLLQAMALGKAVVTTSLGAEGLAANPPLKVADSAAEIAVAVGALLDDPEARRALGHRAREFVAQHHSWSGFAARLADIYRELGLEA